MAFNLTFRAWFEPWAVDLNDTPAPTSLTLWPNPTSDILTIKSETPFPAGSGFKILDLNGHPVHEGLISRGQTSFTADVSQLRASLYLVLVTRPGEADQHLRFVKID